MKENTITFKSDTVERKKHFTADSFSHPAKMVLGLQIYLIEHYTKPGDTILDPMAGTGSLLIACTLGRNVILVELEDKFVKMQQGNWQKIKSMGPMLGHTLGTATILQGDARNLDGMLADNILFSPPYAEATHHSDNNLELKKHGINLNRKGRVGGTAGDDKNNIGNLPYKADAVITSPPYAETGVGDWKTGRDEFQEWVLNELTAKGYVEWQGKRYAESEWRALNHGRLDGRTTKGVHKQPTNGYGKQDGQIGNLKSENYLSAMAQVYRQCHSVLKPDGLFVLVTKNFIRDKQIIRLDTDTIKLCEQAGFKLKERLARKLTQQSFWRLHYHNKYPDVEKIEHEDILIFLKGKRDG